MSVLSNILHYFFPYTLHYLYISPTLHLLSVAAIINPDFFSLEWRGSHLNQIQTPLHPMFISLVYQKVFLALTS